MYLKHSERDACIIIQETVRVTYQPAEKQHFTALSCLKFKNVLYSIFNRPTIISQSMEYICISRWQYKKLNNMKSGRVYSVSLIKSNFDCVTSIYKL